MRWGGGRAGWKVWKTKLDQYVWFGQSANPFENLWRRVMHFYIYFIPFSPFEARSYRMTHFDKKISYFKNYLKTTTFSLYIWWRKILMICNNNWQRTFVKFSSFDFMLVRRSWMQQKYAWKIISICLGGHQYYIIAKHMTNRHCFLGYRAPRKKRWDKTTQTHS